MKDTDDAYEAVQVYEIYVPVVAKVRFVVEAPNEKEAVECALEESNNGYRIWNDLDDAPEALISHNIAEANDCETTLLYKERGACKYCGRKKVHASDCEVEVE